MVHRFYPYGMRKNGFYIRRLLSLMFFTWMTLWLHAQNNLAFYPVNDQFNAAEFNPAFLASPEKFTFSIFPLAGLSISMNNQALLRDALMESRSGVISEDYYEDLFEKMLDKSSFHENVEATFLNFTYRSKKGFLNFRVKDRQFLEASINGEITNFIFKRDIYSAVVGRVQHFPVQSAHYREYSLGYSFASPDKRLTAGARGKLYFGKYSFYSSIDAFIGTQGGEYGLVTTGEANISFPGKTIRSLEDDTYTVDLSNENIKGYLFNAGNPGLGVDLGINYRVNEDVDLSFSVIDLGWIGWKKNLNSRKMDKVFPLYYATYGVDTLNGVPTITKRENYAYSNTFDFFDLEDDSASFSKPLPVSIYAGVKYQVSPGLYLSVTDRLVAMKNLSYNSLSLAATLDVNRQLTLSTGYSMIGNSHLNIPFALLFRHSFGQVYLGSDNLAFLFSPSRANYASVSFGACFYLFTHRNLLLKRSEYLPFYQPRKTIKNRSDGLIIKARKKEK